MIRFILGDFAFGSKDMVKEILRKLNGHVRLVLGNHDEGHSLSWWQDCGFNRVYDKPILWHEFFLLSHEPLEWTCNLPFASLYGHVHNRPEFIHTAGTTYNVGVDVRNFTPVSQEQLMFEMREVSDSPIALSDLYAELD